MFLVIFLAQARISFTVFVSVILRVAVLCTALLAVTAVNSTHLSLTAYQYLPLVLFYYAMSSCVLQLDIHLLYQTHTERGLKGFSAYGFHVILEVAGLVVSLVCLVSSYVYAQTHMHTHTLTYTDRHTHTRTQRHTFTHTHTHTRTHTTTLVVSLVCLVSSYVYVGICTDTHAHTYTNIH